MIHLVSRRPPLSWLGLLRALAIVAAFRPRFPGRFAGAGSAADPATSSAEAGTDDRLHRIEAITDVALATLDVDDLLQELLNRTQELLNTDTAAVLLLDEPTDHLVAIAAKGIEEEVRQGVRIPLGRGFAGRIAAQRRPVIIDEVDHGSVLNPILREKGIRSLLGVPLMVSGARVIGVLHVGTLSPRRFTDEDVELLQLAAERVALAVQSLQSEQERAAATVLQRSLLPGRLPDVPGLALATRYVAGGQGDVGGDWYDMFRLPSECLCLTIGDVVGRGLRAAAVMGRLRSTIRTCALGSDDPAEVLQDVDANVRYFEPGQMATVICAIVEPSLDRVHVSVAGHPAPVLAVPDRPTTLVDTPIDPPIGVTDGVRRHTTALDLPPGAVLCLYTDGLVERRDVALDSRLELLRQAVRPDPPLDVCAAMMGRLVGAETAKDDIAVVVARRVPPSEIEPFDVVAPAVPASVAGIRWPLRRWLLAVGAGAEDVTDLLVAVDEATSNVVEHAYDRPGGTVAVHVGLHGDELVATVRDTGRWRWRRRDDEGRGLILMDRCTDELRIDRGTDHPNTGPDTADAGDTVDVADAVEVSDTADAGDTVHAGDTANAKGARHTGDTVHAGDAPDAGDGGDAATHGTTVVMRRRLGTSSS